MLTQKQREEREALDRKHGEITEALAFAVDHKKPWHVNNWDLGESETVRCDEHGDYQRHTLTGKGIRGEENIIQSRCPTCLRDELARIDTGIRNLKVSSLLNDAGIALRFHDCEFENYQTVNADAEKNLAACRRYVEKWDERMKAGTGLVMVGNCGTGKNHLAISMAKAVIRNHLARVEITDVMRIMRAVKNTWRNHSDVTEDRVLEHYASLDLLIIDEVGVQFGSPSELAILQEVINTRYESMLPTILISNLTLDQMKESIGERIVDRVTDGGRNRLTFGWESFRGHAGGVAA